MRMCFLFSKAVCISGCVCLSDTERQTRREENQDSLPEKFSAWLVCLIGVCARVCVRCLPVICRLRLDSHLLTIFLPPKTLRNLSPPEFVPLPVSVSLCLGETFFPWSLPTCFHINLFLTFTFEVFRAPTPSPLRLAPSLFRTVSLFGVFLFVFLFPPLLTQHSSH